MLGLRDDEQCSAYGLHMCANFFQVLSGPVRFFKVDGDWGNESSQSIGLAYGRGDNVCYIYPIPMMV